mmetsp:Transcript_10164/g.32082  ORF Transcript_10164/g.32082 Transcript_10164/m.32082 type:complete len:217 (+) Transcript_10164:497-1147(+)
MRLVQALRLCSLGIIRRLVIACALTGTCAAFHVTSSVQVVSVQSVASSQIRSARLLHGDHDARVTADRQRLHKRHDRTVLPRVRHLRHKRTATTVALVQPPMGARALPSRKHLHLHARLCAQERRKALRRVHVLQVRLRHEVVVQEHRHAARRQQRELARVRRDGLQVRVLRDRGRDVVDEGGRQVEHAHGDAVGLVVALNRRLPRNMERGAAAGA